MSNKVFLCSLAELPMQGARGFDPWQAGQDTVFVVRQGDAIYGYHDVCPHYGDTALPWRKDEYLDPFGETIMCAAHGAHFEITTGRCIAGPCLDESLPGITLEINEKGEVFARLTRQNGKGESP